jgi:hypothetical protein
MRIARYQHSRFWAVWDGDGTLVCLCVYKRGALEVVRRLTRGEAVSHAVRPGGLGAPHVPPSQRPENLL